jgi:hypothetical protein
MRARSRSGRILATLLLLLLPSTTLAQTALPTAGLFGGLNRNAVTGVGPATARIGGQAGVFLSFPVGSHLGFRPEAGVSWKQIQATSGGLCSQGERLCLSAPETERATFTWIEVPLLADVRLPGSVVAGLTPHLLAGPFVGVRLGKVACTHIGPPAVPDQLPSSPAPTMSSCDDAYEADGGSPASNGDAGFVLGGTLRRGSVGLGLRWTRSLVDAVRYSPVGYSPLMGGRHSTVSLTVEAVTRLGR